MLSTCDLIKKGPKFIVLVQDHTMTVSNLFGEVITDHKQWFFVVNEGKNLLKELKRHSLPGRTMTPFSINLQPVKFIPNMKWNKK